MSDPLDRNLEALLRAAVARPGAAAAKARFLAAAGARLSPWPLALAAAALLLATLVAVARRSAETGPVQRSDAAPAQEAAWIALRPQGEDRAVTLKARLPAPRARTPLLRLEGGAELPDGFRLFVTVTRERETFDGRRLRPEPSSLDGGYVEVLRGRFGIDVPWREPGPFVVRADGGEAHQTPETRAAVKSAPPARDWRFAGWGWTDALVDGLAAAGDEIDAAAADLLAAVKEVEAACASKERWTREAPRLRPVARALRERMEKLPARERLTAAGELLLRSARNLDGDAEYFAWDAEGFQGPVSYHADRQKMKTYRGDAWTFATLRRYAEEARATADREIALWLLKDRRRAGPRPVPDVLWKRPGLAPYRERLAGVDGLDALEEEIRAGR